MAELTLGVVGQALFSLDLLGSARETGDAVRDVLAEMRYPALYVLTRMLLPWLPLRAPANRRFDSALLRLDAVVHGMIEERRRTKSDVGDLMSLFLQAQDDETGAAMDDRQVRDEVMSMILAGHETTAAALSWTWYLLSQHPVVERSLHRELAEVLNGRTPTFDDLPRLTVTRSIIQESMRLFPPVHTLPAREAQCDDTIGGYAIPAGAQILIQPYVVHRHPEFWPEPESFIPDRFLPEQAQGRHRFAYLPFGVGAHTCIGMNFAMTEMVLIIACLAQHWRLELAPGQAVTPQPQLTLQPRDGLKMIRRRR